jgi:hypothetical protein
MTKKLPRHVFVEIAVHETPYHDVIGGLDTHPTLRPQLHLAGSGGKMCHHHII